MGQNVLMSGCKSSSFRVFLLSREHTPWRETQRDQTRLTAARERGGPRRCLGLETRGSLGRRKIRPRQDIYGVSPLDCALLLFSPFHRVRAFIISKVDASCSWEAR